MEPGKGLNLLADFRIGRQIARLDAAATNELGRFAFGGEVFRFSALIHEACRLERDRMTKFDIRHGSIAMGDV